MISIAHRRIVLGGTTVDLLPRDDALAEIADHARSFGGSPLGVVSANVDHIHHFGTGGRWHGVLDARLERSATGKGGVERSAPVEWLTLVDGAPLVSEARRLTGDSWPRLAGSDLIGPILDLAESDGLRLGVLGGGALAHEKLRAVLGRERPGLRLAGTWSPTAEELAEPRYCERLADEVKLAAVDVLVVSLGKPRQELWIAEYGSRTGARVLLAFGAVVDFLGGRVRRAPEWMARHGLEWAWRLALEPRRLARRYLVDGPVAYVRLRFGSAPAEPPVSQPARRPRVPATVGDTPSGRFLSTGHADVAVIVVTHNSATTLDALLASLRIEARSLRLRVVIADNASSDDSLAVARRHGDAVVIDTMGNWGYAGGINRALPAVGEADAVLILNPDLTVTPGALVAMLARLREDGVGIVVPRLVGDAGEVAFSLRREPTIIATAADALLGNRCPGRPRWLSETDHAAESYRHPHPVEWATGAAMLIDSAVVERVGKWREEFFLYSEETDYFRRARETGAGAWFESAAEMVHHGGGSGGPIELTALLTVNRVRYAEVHHGRLSAWAFRVAVFAGELARASARRHRVAAWYLLDRRRWDRLPHASAQSVRAGLAPALLAELPEGAIIIPAHNEAATLARTLRPLAPLAATGRVEIFVVCNGCDDDTAERARQFDSVVVVEIPERSKAAALNVGDSLASKWPRLYLDADIELAPEAVIDVLTRLTDGDLLAARPDFRYDTSNASFPVRCFYRARSRMTSTTTALWGAGVYAVGKTGHERFAAFPEGAADDLFVHGQFGEAERSVVPTAPAIVRVPRTAAALVTVLRRTHSGNFPRMERTTGGTARELISSAHGAAQLFDAGVYALLATLARLRAADPPGAWARDETNRQIAEAMVR